MESKIYSIFVDHLFPSLSFFSSMHDLYSIDDLTYHFTPQYIIIMTVIAHVILVFTEFIYKRFH